MADRDKERDGYGVSSSRGANEGENYGDDQGARVGKPKERGRERSIDDEPKTRGGAGKTGAGGESEAEPVERTREHVSGYGGAGGTPKTSSDQREPHEPTGKKPA